MSDRLYAARRWRIVRFSIVAVAALAIVRCGVAMQRPPLPAPTTQPTQVAAASASALVATATLPPEVEERLPTLITPKPKPTATPIHTDAWSSVSPTGQWIAEGMMQYPFPSSGGDEYLTRLKVRSADRSIEWSVVDEVLHWGLGYTTPRPFHWSSDGKYLYFTNLPVPDGCALFVNGSDLHRVDLTDGSVTEIVPDVGPVLSLSPDETTLTYISWGMRELVLRDLVSGSEQRVQLAASSDVQAGNITWSPDGSELLLATASRPCNPPEWTQSIVRVNVTALSTTTLIRDDDRLFGIVDWPEPARARLSDKDGNTWWLDAVTGQLTPTQ